MSVDDTPEDESVRQSYNFAPGYYGLVYRADVPDYGAGPRKHQDGEDQGQVEQAESEALQPAPEETDTHYKLQSMKWGKIWH
jgi:hypothetical protein